MKSQSSIKCRPRVSVLMAVYNAEQYLADAVESVLEQTFRDFEFLILNDGSSDQSLEIIKNYAAREPRIQVISRENRGLAKSLNELVRTARGQYLARMDGDDICLPDRFEKQAAYLDTNPDCVVVGGQVLLIDGKGRELAPMMLPCAHDDIDDRHMMGIGSVLCHPTAMIRTDALRRVGGYNETMAAAQDLDLWLRLAETGRLANLDQCVLRYRQHLMSVGYADRHQQRMTAWRAIRNAHDRRGLSFVLPSPAGEPPVIHAHIYRKWGWWALGAGNVTTARHYAKKCLLEAPADKETWRLFVCALRGW